MPGPRITNGWKAAALILAGAITAGGASAAIGHLQYERATARITASEIALAELRTTLSDLSERTKELAEQTRELNRELGRLREELARNRNHDP